MNKIYVKSLEMLCLYINSIKLIPSEKQWNKFALQEKILSSKSIQYYSEIKFNKLCNKILKNK